MGKIWRLALIMLLAVAFCFAEVVYLKAGSDDPVTEGWAKGNLINKQKAAKIPTWQITADGTAKAVRWENAINPRFAIYDSGTIANESDDLVLDRETGLVWARDASSEKEIVSWYDAIIYCRRDVELGNRKGFRLPTIEELLSLVDPSQNSSTGTMLPVGHPFLNAQYAFWSSTTDESNNDNAWLVHMHLNVVSSLDKNNEGAAYAWPVRGGFGPISVSQTPAP